MIVLGLIVSFVAVYDFCQRRIPNGLLLLIIINGFIYRMHNLGVIGLLVYMVFSVGTIALLFPIFKVGGLGAGDVKLFGLVAGYLPFGKILYFLFFSMLIAAIISLFKIILFKNIKERWNILIKYFRDVAERRSLFLYPVSKDHDRKATVSLSAPILCSLMFFWGGVY